MLRDLWERVKRTLVGDGYGKHAKPSVRRARRAERDDIWDDYDDYDGWSPEDEDDPDAMRRTGGNPYYDPYFRNTHPDGFPVVRPQDDTTVEQYSLGRNYVRNWYREFTSSIIPPYVLGVVA